MGKTITFESLIKLHGIVFVWLIVTIYFCVVGSPKAALDVVKKEL